MSRTGAFLADVLAIAVFALLARMAHQSEEMPLTVSGWLSTLWPFLIGVAVAWVVIGAARWEGARLHPAGWVAWLIVVAVGLAIWGLRNQAIPHWSFIIVAAVMSVILMLGWRLVAQARSRRTLAPAAP
ncbi:MAG TPA: DUF3054 domain-containing protein [Corynebacterium sp.]|nr:DUF3054 domain-containing protein [Corynebacterium sp.]